MKTNNVPSKKEGYKSWRKSIEKDGVTKSISVEQCENGFIVCISESGQKKGEWFDEAKKYISTKNPLEKEPEIDEDEDWKEDLLESIKEMGI